MTDDRYYEDRVVRLAELVGAGTVLDGFTFVGCQIDGPAVILPRDSIFAGNNFSSPNPEALFWEVPTKRKEVVGVIEVRNCTFERCRFSHVGIAGPPQLIKHFRASLHPGA
ncbi:MAG TPA: hypothetical protein VFC99_11430 [Acidimicrobiia bacterium]|nr:hypothetical protein [Acidimicrobiia bacterium]